MKNCYRVVTIGLVLAMALGGISFGQKVWADDDSGNAGFTITSVAPHECSPETATSVTITGTVFTSGLEAGIAKEDSVITAANQLTDIAAAYSSATQLTATVPAGLTHGEYDLYVYDPAQATFTYAKKEEAIEMEIEGENDTTAVTESNSKRARIKLWVTFNGVSRTDTKKRWMKVRMNGKNVPILKVRKDDPNSLSLQLNIKYRNWNPATYSLTLTIKERIKVTSGTTKKGRNRYRNTWIRTTYTESDILTVLPAS